MYNQVIPLKGAYYLNEFWFSEAYKSLPNKTRDLLQCMLTELRKKYIKIGKRKEWVVINNGEISFTEQSFRKLTNSSKETYRSAIRNLISRGIVELTYRGGNGRGDRSKYKILSIREVAINQQKWRKYPIENWENDIPTIDHYSIGLKTRFKKLNQSNKLDSTLMESTLKTNKTPTIIGANRNNRYQTNVH